MKNISIIISLILVLYSCNNDEQGLNKDKPLILSDHIIAGQKSGAGISYFDFEPDINCYISEPWVKQDTSIQLDLNKDGINDFIFHRQMSNPGFLGYINDQVTLVPLNNNEVCVIPTIYSKPANESCKHSVLDWVVKLSSSDTIHSLNLSTNKKSLIYEYSDVINPCWLEEGFWSSVAKVNDKYIGFKIVKDNKNYYGWIGMHADNFRGLNFIITDYATTQLYKE